jgi:uncharacterized membrane protein YesL
VIAALRVFRRALGDAWDALVILAALNLLWLALSVTVLLLPAATAALFESTHSLARGEAPGIRDYLDGVRRHLVRAWAWALVNLLVWSVLVANIVFYGVFAEVWAVALRSLFLVLAGCWLISQFYFWPFLLEQEDMNIRRAFRNALLAVLAAPFFALTLGLLGAVVVVLSVALIMPMLALTGSFLSLLASHAVIDRLRAFHKIPAPVEAAE